MDRHHFLLLSCPSPGHINPTLHLAKLLLRLGVSVSFATFVSGLRRIATLPTIPGLHFASFSVGCDDGNNSNHSMEEMKRVGSQSLSSLLLSLSNERGPVTCLIYGFLLPWAATVAREHGIPSAFLSTQSATVIAVYHRYLKAHDGLFNTELGSSLNISLELPGLPPIEIRRPTFHSVTNQSTRLGRPQLSRTHPKLRARSQPMRANKHLDSSISCDLFERSKDYLPWLNSKPDGSVIYVSFGSLAVLQKKQMEENFHGLMESGGVVSPSSWMFLDALWMELHHGESSCRCAGGGMSPVFGPDDKCKADGVWGTGVKARANEEGVVEREEIKKCLEMVMEGGEKGG
ncbi:Crocetin glucosyltransferase, chloroplastic [Vitis vinifera]|uniref:Crocetin glucosyltransferase, chloroplastic n=1 Tax=Vitis vinifera TaxID=29760 RepID=A0A438D6U8_VITVI|nr:Crocetin glucosyltransferase, chloroplastic [Vitis vinifera]